jgi:hypothetical protein
MRITPEKVYCAFYGHKYSEIGKPWFLTAYPHFDAPAKRAIEMAKAIQEKHNIVMSVKQVAALCGQKTPNFVKVEGRGKILLKLIGWKKKRVFLDMKPAVISFDIDGWQSYEDAEEEYTKWRQASIEEINATIKKNMQIMFG